MFRRRRLVSTAAFAVAAISAIVGSVLVFGPALASVTDGAPTTSPPRTTPTTPAEPAVGCTATYVQYGQNWPGGFQGEVRVTNASAVPMSGWILTIGFHDGQAITHSWGGHTAASASPYVVTPEAWNSALPPGGVAIFGFLGSQSGTNNPPSLTCLRAP